MVTQNTSGEVKMQNEILELSPEEAKLIQQRFADIDFIEYDTYPQLDWIDDSLQQVRG